MNLPLARARTYAEKIVRELTPYCSRIQVAGSIRRGRPTCHDIDLVCIPSDLAGLRARVQAAAQQELCCGEQVFRTVLKTGVQLDVYFAHSGAGDLLRKEPSNWGTLLLCRTGSKEHNIRLARKAAQLGMRWEPHRGVVAGPDLDVIASETEADVFRALKMDFVEPERRD